VKKLISIGVALALLAMVIVPVTVAAQDYTPVAYNSTYSKIPFGILSTGLNLVATLLGPDALGTALALPAWLPDAIGPVADWVGGPFAWLTELTAWSMVTVGDVMAKVGPLLEAVSPGISDTLPLGDVATLFYTIANRIFDTGNIPTSEMTAQLPPALGLLP
jgi:hypothetical protein